MKTEEALAVLPAVIGEGFQFVGKIVSMNSDEGTIEATYTYRLDDPSKPYLRDHLLGDPLMPGTLIAEGIAQVCGVLATACLRGKLKTVRSRGYDRLRFHGEVRPGDTVLYRGRLTKRKRTLWIFSVTATAEEKKVASCDGYLISLQ